MVANPLGWQVEARCGAARAGTLQLARGRIHTPAFMPVGTAAAVKGATAPEDLQTLGYEIILANTFHLWLRPGQEVIRQHGGVHGFCGWSRPVLTDSGGFQVFSLQSLRKISEDGVHFRAPHNGESCFLTPELCMEIQHTLNSDIAMVLDDCAPATASRQTIAAAMRRSMRWAKRCADAFAAAGNRNALFGIVQGGLDDELRSESVQALLDIGFDGYAIGGLAVGESAQQRQAVLQHTCPQLPDTRPRYLMGVGRPCDIAQAVACGVDMFDCVLPTRNARNGHLFTRQGVLRIRNAQHRHATGAIDEACACWVCQRFSRAYLHHLFAIGDMLAARLATFHNLAYYRSLMHDLRQGIMTNTLDAVVHKVLAAYPPEN